MHYNPGPPSHSTYPPPQSPEQMPIERSPLNRDRGGVFHVAVTLHDGRHTGTITLVNDHGWKVRYLDSQLHLDG